MELVENDQNEILVSSENSSTEPVGHEEIELEDGDMMKSTDNLCPTEQQNSNTCSKGTKIIAIQLVAVATLLTVILSVGFYFTSPTNLNDNQNHTQDISVNDFNGTLLSYFVPVHYNVSIRVDFDEQNPNPDGAPQNDRDAKNKETFTGDVSMLLKCKTMTDKIMLHSDALHVKSLTIYKVEDVDDHYQVSQLLNITDIVQNKLREVMIISLDKPIDISTFVKISLTFTGLMNHTDRHGLSLVHYEEDDGTLRQMAVSSLSPSYTRRLFPCLDGPTKKATFRIRVRRNPGYSIVSNMPVVKSIVLEDGNVIDYFARTPKIAPHSLSLVILRLNRTQITWKGLTINFWARDIHLPSVENITELVPPLIEALQIYTGIMYPLPKLDIVAVPDNILRRADNWGCAISSERSLPFSSDFTSVTIEDEVEVVVNVALMVSHQWFGNLVNCGLWRDLWLQEGLAMFFAFKALDYANTESKMHEIMMSMVESALEKDGKGSYSLHESVEFFDEKDSVFAMKSAALIRMTYYFITEPSFQLAIRHLLNSRAHNTISAADFYESMEQFEIKGLYQRPANVSKILQSWVQNPTYPVVSVKWDGSTFVMSQYPFPLFYEKWTAETIRPNNTPDSPWIIPITYRTFYSSPSWNMTWLENGSSILPGDYINTSLPIINTLEQGCYRVLYDDKTWKIMLFALSYNHTSFNVETRAGLISDVFALARVHLIDEIFVLQFVTYLRLEREFLPWHTFLRDSALSFGYYDRMLFSTKLYPRFQDFIRKLVKPIYLEINSKSIPKKEYPKRLLQVKIIHLACQVGLADCTSSAAELYKHCMDFGCGHTLNPDIKKTTFCYGVKLGGDKEWWYAFQKWNDSRGRKHSDHRAWGYALGCSGNLAKLRLYLKGVIKEGDFQAVQTLISQVKSLSKILPLLQNSWGDIRRTFGTKRRYILENVALSVVTVDGLKKLGYWIDPIIEAGEDQAILSSAIPLAEQNLIWMKKNYKPIRLWLAKLAAMP